MRLEINENPNNSDKMEQGENSLSQQAGDLLGRGANTSSTSADRAEASKALTKDGTLPDFQLDMGTDDTSPTSASKEASSDKPGRDEFDRTPEAKGDSDIPSASGDKENAGFSDSSTNQESRDTPESTSGDSVEAPPLGNSTSPGIADSGAASGTSVNVNGADSSDSAAMSGNAGSSEGGGGSDLSGIRNNNSPESAGDFRTQPSSDQQQQSSSDSSASQASPAAAEGGGGSSLGLSSGGDKETSPVGDTQTQPTQFPPSAGSESGSSSSSDIHSNGQPADPLDF
ncbi:MAG: hypothetical protein WC028_20570 [Candidatus Obscuribacterales bacterium]